MTEPRSPTGLPARRAALDLLAAALSRRAGLEDEQAAPGLAGLEPRDRAFARMLVLTVLRRLGPIDRALDARIPRAPPEIVRNILRLGAAQALALGAPPHAAVSASVDLAESLPAARRFKGLVNAVLRGLLRQPPDLDDPEVLAPDWLLARWSAAWGRAEALAVASVIATEPDTDLLVRGEPGPLVQALELTPVAADTWRSARRGEVSAWEGFAEGRWWVQDASAAVPARLLRPRPGLSALDMCAAPGGKTLQLTDAGARVTALDRSAARLRRLSENLERTGLSADVIAADAATWDDGRTFDAVLLDAPCSATGTFRRNPDVLWAVRPGDIATLVAAQSRLLDAAARRVSPGGRLVYCVCSLEPEEGEGQVAAFRKRHSDFALDPIAHSEGGAPPGSRREDGTLRILPTHRTGGTDGFYIARFARRPNRRARRDLAQAAEAAKSAS
ncbi:MAG: RsmB/NOP family class I SAM-dependent RNA methyltransferase [Phenylobacterium sp.]